VTNDLPLYDGLKNVEGTIVLSLTSPLTTSSRLNASALITSRRVVACSTEKKDVTRYVNVQFYFDVF